nr:MAG TPA: hypothetical protein [Caudoviricetes sp.]
MTKEMKDSYPLYSIKFATLNPFCIYTKLLILSYESRLFLYLQHYLLRHLPFLPPIACGFTSLRNSR